MKKLNRKSWDDISLNDFRNILSFLEVEDEYTMLNILGVIYPDVDFEEMTLNDFAKYKGSLDFMQNNINKNKPKKHYTLNNTKYDSNFDITSLTVSQFIDYLNYAKKERPLYEELLSVFFTPAGHTYNDGYDINKVKEDLRFLKMPDVMGMVFFFVTLCKELLILSQHYLTLNLQKMKNELSELDQMKMQEALEILKEIELQALGYCPTF